MADAPEMLGDNTERAREFAVYSALTGALPSEMYGAPVPPDSGNEAPQLLDQRVPGMPVQPVQSTSQSMSQGPDESQSTLNTGPAPAPQADIWDKIKAGAVRNSPNLFNALGSGLALASGNRDLLTNSLQRGNQLIELNRQRKVNEQVNEIMGPVTQLREQGKLKESLQALRDAAARTDLHPEVSGALGKQILDESQKIGKMTIMQDSLKDFAGSKPEVGALKMINAGMDPKDILTLRQAISPSDKYQVHILPDGLGYVRENKITGEVTHTLFNEVGGRLKAADMNNPVFNELLSAGVNPYVVGRAAMSGDQSAMKIMSDAKEAADARKNPEDDFDRAVMELSKTGKFEGQKNFKNFRELTGAKGGSPSDVVMARELAIKNRRESQAQRYEEMGKTPLFKVPSHQAFDPKTLENISATHPTMSIEEAQARGHRLVTEKSAQAIEGTKELGIIANEYRNVAKQLTQAPGMNFGQWVKAKGQQWTGFPGVGTDLAALDATALRLGKTFQGAAAQLSDRDVESIRGLMPTALDTAQSAERKINIMERIVRGMRSAALGGPQGELDAAMKDASAYEAPKGKPRTLRQDGYNIVVPGSGG
jgi:hypothetical protein